MERFDALVHPGTVALAVPSASAFRKPRRSNLELVVLIAVFLIDDTISHLRNAHARESQGLYHKCHVGGFLPEQNCNFTLVVLKEQRKELLCESVGFAMVAAERTGPNFG